MRWRDKVWRRLNAWRARMQPLGESFYFVVHEGARIKGADAAGAVTVLIQWGPRRTGDVEIRRAYISVLDTARPNERCGRCLGSVSRSGQVLSAVA